MEIGTAFKFLHIATMVTAVTLALGPSLVGDAMVAAGDVAGTRAFVARMGVFERAIPALFVIGAAFGLLAAATIGFDLLAPWLLIAYALFLTTMGIQMSVGARWRRRLGAILATVGPVAVSPALAEVGSAAAGRLAYWYTAAATALIIFDMVAKPFS
jgi:hypothetical protein